MSSMFASLVMQNANMALIFLGRRPSPDGQDLPGSGKRPLFHRPTGNVGSQDQGQLEQARGVLFEPELDQPAMAFVEAVEHPAAETAAPPRGPPTDEQETPVTDPAGTGETTKPRRTKPRPGLKPTRSSLKSIRRAGAPRAPFTWAGIRRPLYWRRPGSSKRKRFAGFGNKVREQIGPPILGQLLSGCGQLVAAKGSAAL